MDIVKGITHFFSWSIIMKDGNGSFIQHVVTAYVYSHGAGTALSSRFGLGPNASLIVEFVGP